MPLPKGDRIWARHAGEWRDPAEVITGWPDAGRVAPELLRLRVEGAWWDTLEEQGVTLLVTREYEHLIVAMAVEGGSPQVSFLPLPHPSGIAVDRQTHLVQIASTRNPNQIYAFRPVLSMLSRSDVPPLEPHGHPLLPVRSTFHPGCLYIHDLGYIGGVLHANAVGQNAVVRIHDDGRVEPVWWPRAIDTPSGPLFGRNYLQVNSIAAGCDIPTSYFSASGEHISSRRPGHRNYPVNGRGVIFSGATREPIARGLTRPHSARVHDGAVWVDNSGYGEVGFIEDGRFNSVLNLPGWTRGLSFHGDVAFVGTSRVLPRFRQYAPGLDAEGSICAVHAVDCRTGTVLGSATWPAGNQIFAIDWIDTHVSSGLPFRTRQSRASTRTLFYAFGLEDGG